MSTLTQEELQAVILGLDGEVSVREASSVFSVKVPVGSMIKVMTLLKNDARLDFDQLQLHTAMDWVEENRMECLYLLISTRLNHEVMVSVSVPRTPVPVVESVSKLWPIAEWQEREVYDMFGMTYENHPDLRRLFLEDDWKGFPLRKDYEDDFVLRRPW